MTTLVERFANTLTMSKPGTKKSDPPGKGLDQNLPSWEALAKILEASPDVRSESFSKTKLRLFRDDKEPSLTFYRDDSAWCPFCEYIWISLEEKKISYVVKKIHLSSYGRKPDWYYQIVPSGLVPGLDINGEVVGTESPDLLYSLEEKFPSHRRLLPAEGSTERNAVSDLVKLQEEFVGAWRENFLGAWKAVDKLEGILTKIDMALQKFGGPYFLGKEVSLVDAHFVPFLERASSVLPYFHGLEILGSGKWPALEGWFQAWDSWPTYQLIRTDDFTNVHQQKRTFNSEQLPAGAAFRDKIDGKDGSWDLPLKPVHLPLGSDDGSGKDGAKEEAAKTLVYNHEGVVRFASRGIKEEAEAYKDIVYSPEGVASRVVQEEETEKFLELIDLAFRYVATALLVGFENAGPLPTTFPKEVAIAAEYLRDRVGVPRDLTFPAARQLRAHLQWLVKRISSQTKHRT